jgi:GMP synthase (glutamine-hydrolysing)
MKHAVAIRHVACEDLGNLEDVLYAHDFDVRYLEAGVDDLAGTDAMTADLLILLGGPIGAFEENTYPFLAQELRLLEKRLTADTATIGICLGAQLMARVLGEKVYAGDRKEIGWAPITLSEAGQRSALAHLSGDRTAVLHWHGDTFECPDGATHLAATTMYHNQAFSWGRRCLALQFHPEATLRGFERWLISHACEIHATLGCSVAQLRDETQRHADQLRLAAQEFWRAWLSASYE